MPVVCPMKKLLYSGIAFGLLLFVLVVILGAFALFQRLSLKDGMVFMSARLRGGFVLSTEDGFRKFQVIEVVCKHKEPFNAALTLGFEYGENEREDGLRRERIDLPERPTKRSNGIWMTRFYVLGAEDGAIGVFDTMPTLETIQNNPEILESLVPYHLPQKKITWHVSSMQNTDYEEISTGIGAGYSIVQGFEGRWPIIMLGLTGRSLADTEE